MKLLASQKIRFFRKLKRFTQESLAEVVGINYRHLQKLESGKVDIKVETLERISEKLDVPACYLLESVPGHTLSSIQMPCPVVLLDSFPAGVAVSDLQGTLVYCNGNMTQITGHKKSEMIGKMKFWEVSSTQEEEQRVKAYFERLIANRPPRESFLSKFKDGSSTITQYKSDWNYLLNQSGALIGIIFLLLKE